MGQFLHGMIFGCLVGVLVGTLLGGAAAPALADYTNRLEPWASVVGATLGAVITVIGVHFVEKLKSRAQAAPHLSIIEDAVRSAVVYLSGYVKFVDGLDVISRGSAKEICDKFLSSSQRHADHLEKLLSTHCLVASGTMSGVMAFERSFNACRNLVATISPLMERNDAPLETLKSWRHILKASEEQGDQLLTDLGRQKRTHAFSL